jgi:hypothetical protein
VKTDPSQRKGGRGRQDPPYDVLAGQYIRAVMDGRPPGAVCRYKFGLTQGQWQVRRTWLGKTGWLPPGDPVRDGRAAGGYDEAWLEAALELYGAKLAEREERAEQQRQGEQAREARWAEVAATRAYWENVVIPGRPARQRALAQQRTAELSDLVFDILG